MATKRNDYRLQLQLFAEGGDSGDGGTAVSGVAGPNSTKSKGVKGNPLADVQYGKQENVQGAAAQTESEQPSTDGQTENAETGTVTPEDRRAKFDALVKGEFKDLYDSKIQSIVNSRLKSTKETISKYEALTPTLEMLAKRYGVDASDVSALSKAIAEDDSLYEKEAIERGISVEQLREIKAMERENSELRKYRDQVQMQNEVDELYNKWLSDSAVLKDTYPQFELNAELQNSDFFGLLKAGIPIKTAYEVVHKDEIIPAAMQFTAQKTAEKITNKIISNGNRPLENGANGQSPVNVKSDVSQLTKADRDEITRRVARGERISF